MRSRTSEIGSAVIRSSPVINSLAEMATLETGGFECLGGVTRLALSVSEVRMYRHSTGRGTGGSTFAEKQAPKTEREARSGQGNVEGGREAQALGTAA